MFKNVYHKYLHSDLTQYSLHSTNEVLMYLKMPKFE